MSELTPRAVGGRDALGLAALGRHPVELGLDGVFQKPIDGKTLLTVPTPGSSISPSTTGMSNSAKEKAINAERIASSMAAT